ncbi:MAG: lytic transglycosylase domain-containing protein [Acidobacteria bacterium]|nr:lytic transglycosylase domain-containing protein [Acidobacteriota bacterium]MCI0717729.1 lytic transglycosylase domain-containing protein [Acidobacteriota bacterium]
MGLAKLALAFLALAGSSALSAQGTTVREVAARHVERYSRAYKVPVELAEAIIEVESNWLPHAVSSKGAVGLMQLMPATAARFGVRNRFDIEDNIRGGVAYLAWLIRLFEGDLRLAVAAYFVGESPILLRGLAYSSPEVFRYVSRVASRYRAKRLKTIARRGASVRAPGK